MATVDELKAKILPYRKQEELLDSWLKKRLETILPKIMERTGIDTWLVACNEYNEDPMLKSLVPCAMMTARRLTILLLHYKGGKVERYALTRPNVGLDGYYESVWLNQKESTFGNNTDAPCETQMECLARMLKKCEPEKIGIDVSDTFAFADGLSHSLYEKIVGSIDDDLKAKMVSAEKLCVGWLETRSTEEMEAYDGIVEIAHQLIADAFSSKVVIPGVTTNADVKYFMMEKCIELGLEPWFDFEVSIRRKDVNEVEGVDVIRPGDMLHCDVGFRYLNLCTDTQENAYVLQKGETDVPEDLKAAMRTANRLQDITLRCFKEGRTGNEILAMARAKAIEEGIKPCIYSHPIGYHGHAAGPTIGLWDKQDGVPGSGDYPLYDNTAYSLELNCTCEVKSWHTSIQYCAETDVLFTGGKAYYLAHRQEAFHIIK